MRDMRSSGDGLRNSDAGNIKHETYVVNQIREIGVAMGKTQGEVGKTGEGKSPPSGGWTFFTNHAHVLFCLARDPDLRLRDVAERVGITERATQRIVHELEGDGYLRIERAGRRNRYHLELDLPLRHAVERDHSVRQLLEFLFAE
jgi:AraC-like DNA-binding protein